MSNQDPALQNYILANLPRSALDFLRPHLEPVSLPVREVLESPNRLITHVYFPIGGINSVVAGADEQRLEVGIIGRDGMTGLSIVLGVDTSPKPSGKEVHRPDTPVKIIDLAAASGAHLSK